MKKILSTTAIAGSLCLLGTGSFADSKSITGAHIGISASVIGAEFDGKRTASDNTTSMTGRAGLVGGIGDIDVGYTAALDKNSAVTIGVRYIPLKVDGSGTSSDTTTGTTIKGELENIYGAYIKPTYAISKDASVFVGVHYLKGDLNVTGLSATGSQKPGDLEGWGGSVGVRVNLTPSAFLSVEASYTDFDGLRAKDVSNDGIRTKTVTFDPKIAEGRVTLGFTF